MMTDNLPSLTKLKSRSGAFLPDQVMGDQIRLKQILINLIKNALKFTPQGQILIKVAYEWDRQQLIVHVVDTGRGLTNQEMNQLFHMFSKAKRTEDMNIDGIGMGLIICKRIIENSGGEINVVSAGEDRGATFMFSIKMELLESHESYSR